MSHRGKLTYNPLRVLLAIGDGEIDGDDAKVAAALLIDTVPMLSNALPSELIDTAKRFSADPVLRDALGVLLETTEERGSMTVELRDE